MFSHGYNPNQLLQCVIVSIPKDIRRSLSSADNYRGISLVNAMSTLIDIIIIDKCYDNLCTSELQFSFKPEHSTVHIVMHIGVNGNSKSFC